MAKKTATPAKGSTSKKVAPAKVKATASTSATAPAPAKEKKERTEPLSLSSYIVKVSKSAHDNVGVRKNVKEHLEQLLLAFIRLVNQHAEENLKTRKTLQERDIEHAVRVFLPEGTLRDAVLSRAEKVLADYGETKKTAGLEMSVPRVRAWLVWGLSDKENLHVSKNAVVYLTAVLDQFIIELTREANVYSQEKQRSNITLPDFERAVKKTDWLRQGLSVLEVNDGDGDNEEEAPPPVILKKVAKRAPIDDVVVKKVKAKKIKASA